MWITRLSTQSKAVYGDRKRELTFSIPCQQALVDELEQRINFCHTKGMEDEEDYERASKAVGAATGNKPKKSAATPAGKCFLFCFVLFFLNSSTCC